MRAFALAASIVAVVVAVSPAEEPAFAPLFNGKDLSGWKAVAKDAKLDAAATWTVLPGGVLKCSGKPTGYLATEKEYADYVLRLEWKYAPTDLKRPNSGVLLHVQKEAVFWPLSLEAQLAHGQAGDLWFQFDANKKLPTLTIDPARKDAANKDGRHYFRIGKDDPVEKPLGEWNRYEIECVGGTVKLTVNGKLANEGTGGSLTRGRIGLQAEGAEVHFRNVELRPAK